MAETFVVLKLDFACSEPGYQKFTDKIFKEIESY